MWKKRTGQLPTRWQSCGLGARVVEHRWVGQRSSECKEALKWGCQYLTQKGGGAAWLRELCAEHDHEQQHNGLAMRRAGRGRRAWAWAYTSNIRGTNKRCHEIRFKRVAGRGKRGADMQDVAHSNLRDLVFLLLPLLLLLLRHEATASKSN